MREMIAPRIPTDDEAMSEPRVFDSEEEAFAAPTAEEQWLENLDQTSDDEETEQ